MQQQSPVVDPVHCLGSQRTKLNELNQLHELVEEVFSLEQIVSISRLRGKTDLKQTTRQQIWNNSNVRLFFIQNHAVQWTMSLALMSDRAVHQDVASW